MIFVVVFLILYGMAFGICRLATMLFSGSDAMLVKNIAYVPILNVVASILIIFLMVYIVKDYRKNKQQKQQQNAAV